jgi:hypothetical protein
MNPAQNSTRPENPVPTKAAFSAPKTCWPNTHHAMNKLFILFAVALVTSCSTLPEKYSASASGCLVQGVSSGGRKVLIRTVDDGEVLWVRGYHLGDKVWLEPGIHKLSVMCEGSHASGKIIMGTEVELEVVAGYSYYLSASGPLSLSEKPRIEITKKKRN